MFPLESFKWMMSTEPGCFSILSMIPTLPILFPPLMKALLPVSNFKNASILLVDKFNLMVS